MILGWQGFSFEHPDDWALSRVTGTRSRGFLALASSGALACHVRWEPTGDPLKAAERYLGSLSTKKAKVSFDLEPGEEGIRWKRTGAHHGRGFATQLPDGRLLLLEITGRAGDKLLPPLRTALSTLTSQNLWSVFGLAVNLPEAYLLQKAEFLTARTRLTFRAKGATLVAERYGLATQMFGETAPEQWLQDTFPSLPSTETPLELHRPGGGLRPAEAALAHHEPDLNQITVIHARSRRLELLPEWQWFDRIQS